MGSWTLDDIPWEAFDPTRVDPEIVPVIKAASLVEFNAGDYRTYLNNVFADDPRFKRAIDGWVEEEVQHGRALARWAKLADPDFDFGESFCRFTEGFRLPLEADSSVRGSRTGELIARCMVETGTNSYYTGLAAATDEPVLKAICQRIAADEYAHYYLFYTHMLRYRQLEQLGFWRRLWVALTRIAESEDDELAYAFYAANVHNAPYDRKANSAAYGKKTLEFWTPRIFSNSVAMIFRAVGLGRRNPISTVVAYIAWWFIWARMHLAARGAAQGALR